MKMRPSVGNIRDIFFNLTSLAVFYTGGKNTLNDNNVVFSWLL